MMEVFEGHWWLPNNQANKIQGKLTISTGSHSELIVLGTPEQIETVFPAIEPFRSISELGEFDIINGYVKSDKDKDISICLQECRVIRTTSSGLSKITFQVMNVIKVLHFKAYDDIKIQNLFLTFDYFIEWVHRTGFSVELNSDPQVFKSVVEYNQPEPIPLYEDDKKRMYIWFRAKAPLVHKYGPLCLDESVHLNIEFTEQVSLKEAKDLIQVIQDLYSFMIGLPVNREMVEFRRYSNAEATRCGHANHTCELVYPELVVHEKQKIWQDELLISLNSLLANENNVFKSWMTNYEEIAQVMRLYFDSYYKYQISPQTRFLNLCMALEIYHFRKVNSNQGDEKPTQNERITELLNSHNYVSKYFDEDLSLFVRRIIKTRNYFTHGGGENSELIIPTNELFNYSLKLRILLETLILSDLKFSQEQIYDKIKRAYQFSTIIELP